MSNTDKLIAAIGEFTKAMENIKVSSSSENTDVLSGHTAVIKEQTEKIIELTAAMKEKSSEDQESQKSKDAADEKSSKQTEKLIGMQKELANIWPKFGPKLINGLNKFTSALTSIKSSFGNLTKKFKGMFSGGAFGKKLGSVGSLMGKGLKGAFGGIGKLGKSISGIGKGILGGVKSFYGKIKTGLNVFLLSNPIGMAVKKIGGFIFSKTVGKMLGATAKIFKTGITYGAKFAKVMVGLPLQIVGAVAKIGHSFRRNVVEVIGGAVEGVKDFVDVNDGLGKSIKDMSTSSAMSLDKFSDPTTDLVKMFGDGPSGLANALQAAGTAMQDMGQFADVAGRSIIKNEKNFLHYTKATRSLGMASDDIGYITAEAVKNGESIYAALDKVVIASDATSKQFGVDRKKLSKNFFVLRKDITNFGHLSNKELMETSAKLTQMGVSMAEAAAVFNKMDTFESAAQTSAMLSQTFGMNLDALKLLRAEKPEEIIEQFSKAMQSTGRSFDDLNRHEKSLMASHTGLSAESLKMTMNYRNLGMSYKDIQKKMKEDDPTQQQIKNLKMMSGSLKEIKKTLGGENVFKRFADGVLETVKANSGLSKTFLTVSKRFEDFFVAGLKISDKAKGSFEKAFSPFKTVLEQMVGDGTDGNKGLLDASKFKDSFEEFAGTYGDYLGRAFKGDSLSNLQVEIRNSLKSAFDFKNLNQGNTFVGKLFKSSGELIGQILKGFAAFGPGLIDITFDAMDSLIDFLVNYKDSPKANGLLYNNSIKGMLSNLLGLNEDDQTAILGTFGHLIDRVISSTGPLMRLYAWINVKFAELIKDAMSAVINAAEEGFKNTWIGSFIYSFNFGSNKYNFEQGQKGGKSLSLSSLNKESLGKLHNRENYEAFEVDQIGKIYSMLESEAKKQKFDTLKVNKLQKIMNQIQSAKGETGWDLDDDDFVKSIASQVAKYRGITLDIDKANGIVQNAQGKLLGPGGLATLKATPDGLQVTQLAPGDNLVAAKSGEISYGGNAASGFQSVSNISAQQNVGQTSMQGPSELKICLQVDGNTLTEVCLDNDIIRKATQVKNGRATLGDGIVVDAAGSRVQSSNLR